MKQTSMTVTAPVDHSTIGQLMTDFEQSLYNSFHQVTYLPIILFLIAITIFIASFNTKHGGARAAGYVVAVLLVVACVFII
jgi:hypothetical protein